MDFDYMKIISIIARISIFGYLIYLGYQTLLKHLEVRRKIKGAKKNDVSKIKIS